MGVRRWTEALVWRMTQLDEDQLFVDVCWELLARGEIDEENIQTEAHRLIDEQSKYMENSGRET